jgi:PTH1 family peptidyl-tRNA hydrolase
MDPADFVLRDFSPVERKELPFVVADAVDAVTGVVELGWERAQNSVNGERKSRNSS